MVDKKQEPNPLDKFVSRGGMKLQHALNEFALDVNELVCADFGCSVGGFTDCLLQNGAVQIHAIDTAYGVLDYRLRSDDRVQVYERTNILHFPPEKLPTEGVDLVVIDAGWTTQLRILPIAQQWLRTNGHIISLIKPHYEWKNMPADDAAEVGISVENRQDTTILSEEMAQQVCDFVLRLVAARTTLKCQNLIASPIRGGGKRRKKKAGPGNVEYLALLTPHPND